MTRILQLILSPVFFFNLSFSAEPPKLRSEAALTAAVIKNEYTAELKAGFHFNDKAPNHLLVDGKSIKPSKLIPQTVQFQLPKSYKDAKAVLYVCDDLITFCETHHLTIRGEATTEIAMATAKSHGAKDEHGFFNGQLNKAFELAKKKKQLVLLDFTAIWCPGCVRNKGEIFSKSEFKKLSQNIIKVKVDTDLYENFQYSEKYKVVGIPTLILLNADNQEIDRLVGFEPMDRVGTFITTAQKDPTPIQDWTKLDASADPKIQLRAGQRLMAAGLNAEAIPLLSRVQPPPPELLQAKVQAAQQAYEKDNAGQNENFAKALRQALQEESDSTRSLLWRMELVKLVPKSEEAKSVLESGVKLADELVKDEAKLAKAVSTDSVGEYKGFDKWVVLVNKADLLDAAGAPEDQVLKAMSEAADAGIAYKIPPSRRGPALRQLVMLRSSNRWEEAEKYADLLLKEDPGNTDVQRRKVLILTMLKKYNEAIALAEKLLPKVEGRNEFWLAEGLAKAYVAAEKTMEAKKLLTAYLARPEIQADRLKSSKKTMEEILKGLQ
jgi:thiol-disulfide isomerase/thioredoxin